MSEVLLNAEKGEAGLLSRYCCCLGIVGVGFWGLVFFSFCKRDVL